MRYLERNTPPRKQGEVGLELCVYKPRWTKQFIIGEKNSNNCFRTIKFRHSNLFFVKEHPGRCKYSNRPVLATTRFVSNHLRPLC